MRAAAWCLLLSVVAADGLRTAAQEPPAADELLALTGRYTAQFADSFRNVVAEEKYRQEVVASFSFGSIGVGGRGGTVGTPPRSTSSKRELKSDFLLVTLPPAGDLVPFRDTFEVDGAPVRDREQRLTKLFLNPRASALEQATAIAAESARYNIGNVTRTINNPVLSLTLLQAANQPGFKFTIDKQDTAKGRDVWIVEFREQQKPTLIRGIADSDLPAHGRFWVDRMTGRVLRTELQLEEPNVTARISTSFRSDQTFNIDVPSEMTEDYVLTNSRVTDQATYGRFRRFSVNTEEAIGKNP